MNAIEELERGRAAYSREAWQEAYDGLSVADALTALPAEDLEHLGITAHLLGKEPEVAALLTRAHHEFLRAGQVERAVRCVFWLCIGSLYKGEFAQSNGWLGRGRRLLADAGIDCVEQGYMRLAECLPVYWSGHAAEALPGFEEAVAIGERFNEPDLIALARLGVGETLIQAGESARGFALLDEVMASIRAGDLSVLAAGLAYCAGVACCQLVFDLSRAGEWTASFSRWSEQRPGMAAYNGECRVSRAEVMQLRGAWPSAVHELQIACDGLSMPGNKPWAGAAYYQLGELHRLSGKYAEAEAAYQEANTWAFTPQPGLALLRMAQGRRDAAVGAISRALGEAQSRLDRLRMLPAALEIYLALGDIAAARESASEVAALSAGHESQMLQAISVRATGSILVADGDAIGALTCLRRALAIWHELEVPYEVAQTRLLISRACRMLGDADGASLELGAARQAFEQLGALPALQYLDQSAVAPAYPPGGRLTMREIEVLRLVASGRTNRAIAEELVLSEKTVARHVSNIFDKLDLSSRSAATAYAYEHHLL